MKFFQKICAHLVLIIAVKGLMNFQWYTKILKIYDYQSTNYVLIESKQIDSVTIPTLSIGSQVTVTENAYLRDYSYSTSLYYSDFDVLEYTRETESVFVDWYDGSRKLLQTVNKKGFQFLVEEWE